MKATWVFERKRELDKAKQEELLGRLSGIVGDIQTSDPKIERVGGRGYRITLEVDTSDHALAALRPRVAAIMDTFGMKPPAKESDRGR